MKTKTNPPDGYFLPTFAGCNSQFLISNLTKSDLNSILKFKFQLKNLRHLRRYLNFKFELKFEKKDKELAINLHSLW